MKKSRKEYRNHPTETRLQNHKYKKAPCLGVGHGDNSLSSSSCDRGLFCFCIFPNKERC